MVALLPSTGLGQADTPRLLLKMCGLRNLRGFQNLEGFFDSAVYDLYELLIDLGRDTLNLRQMSSADSTKVVNIAGDTTLDASVLAKGILSVVQDTLFVQHPEPFILPSQRLAMDEEEEEEQAARVSSPTNADYFKAYPNPFTNSTTIAYNLGKECEVGCMIRLYDLQGRVILEEQLSMEEGKGQFEVDMSRYGNGIYYCSLYGNQQLLQTEKLILMR